jgi:UDP-3-O-[3-hydroxymyristoyl] N-acetylglucosamine deacetylase
MLNNLLLRELLAHPEAYEVVSFDDIQTAPQSYVRQVKQEWAFN